MQALQVVKHATQIEALQLAVSELPTPRPSPGDCLVKVVASGVNPSDALAAMGYFQGAQCPRIPGRDFSGVVVEGPRSWKGRAVWGSGGAAGIEFDGTQRAYLSLPTSGLALTPPGMDLVTAGAQCLPYLTAYYSLVKRAHLQPGETVLVVGALGQVGSAAMSIAAWKNCQAIALVRGQSELNEAQQRGWLAVDSQAEDLAQALLAINQGQPFSVILNSIGNLAWGSFINVLAAFGRIVTIAAREQQREATINLFDLYRANQTIIGVNTLPFSYQQNALWLSELSDGFANHQLIPLTVNSADCYRFIDATLAYQRVAHGTSSRIVLTPEE